MNKNTNMDELLTKIEKEFEQYKELILDLEKEDILEHAYGYALRENILNSLYDYPLEEDEAAILLKSRTPLLDLVTNWEEAETGHMTVVRSMIKSYVNIKCGGDK